MEGDAAARAGVNGKLGYEIDLGKRELFQRFVRWAAIEQSVEARQVMSADTLDSGVLAPERIELLFGEEVGHDFLGFVIGYDD